MNLQTMVRRWLAVVAFYYPCQLAATLLMVTLPGLLWNWWTGAGFGSFEIQRFGAFPMGMRMMEMFSGDPLSTLGIAAALLAWLAIVAVALARWSAIAGAIVLCAGSLVFLPYWMFLTRDRWWLGAAGVALSVAGMIGAQRLLLRGTGYRFWQRLLESWIPLAAGGYASTYLAFDFRMGRMSTMPLLPLAVAALLSSLLPVSTGPAASVAIRTILAGLLLTGTCVGGLQWSGRWMAERRQAAIVRGLAETPAVPLNTPYERLFFQRGMSMVADRESFGSETAHSVLKAMAAQGVDAVSIVMHGLTPRPQSRESQEAIELLTRRAHVLGMKVFLKPHHRPRGGDLATEDSRRRWFALHAAGIEEIGRFAARIHADLYCIGYEMGKAYQYESEWREVIRRARSVYPGPLTACPTQGEEFEGIRFWDALDYIGVDNYYPLPDNYDYSAVVRKMEAIANQYQKPVLFTEAGFASVSGSHREPWAEPRREVSMQEQERCYRALLEAVYDKPWFMGVYWWKVDTDGAGGPRDRMLTPWRKPAMELVKSWYLSGRRR